MSIDKKRFACYSCCFILIVSFLVAVPILSHAAGSEAAGQPGGEISADPMDRLPATPEEAHQRLEEKDINWPDSGAFAAAAAYEGVAAGVRVAIPFDTVSGFTTHINGGVKVELKDGATVKQTVNTTTGTDGWFKADLSAGDIESGNTVVVTDLEGGTGATVNCTLTAAVDFNNNRVTGTSVAANDVDAFVVIPNTYYADLPPGAMSGSATAGTGGAYSIALNRFDLRLGDAVTVFSTNAAGHMVMNEAGGSGGSLVVYPQYDDVMGYYIPDRALTVNVGTASRDVETLGDGFFEAWFADTGITDGQTVSTNMGGARGIIVRDVAAQCDPSANVIIGTAPASRDLRVVTDPYVDPTVYEVTSDASGNFAVTLGAGDPATGTDVYNVAWYDDEGDCVVYEFQTFSWYLAEGYTGEQFDTWVLVQNPGSEDAAVTLSFQLVGGEASPYTLVVPAGMRTSIQLDVLPGLADAQVSTMVTSISGNWIVAERAVYFVYQGKPGGHDSIGALSPSDTWYLAEGYTGGEFDTWVLVQNPGLVDTNVTLEFQVLGGAAENYNFVVPAGKRESVPLDALPGLADAQVSTKVSADQPVVAERAVYFNYGGWCTGGHDSIGVTAPADTWYLAEGYTGGTFDTWVLVQNAGTEDTMVTLSFQLVSGTADDYTFEVKAGKRESVPLDALPGLADAQVSTKVSATKPVVAERAMYFDYNGKIEGHDSIGASAPKEVWYMAEGYTGGEFDTWVLVQNPGTEDTTVTLSFQLVSGTAEDYVFNLPAGMRQSVPLDYLPGLADAQVSTKVSATKPVVAERAEYFNYNGITGGHASIAIPEILK